MNRRGLRIWLTCSTTIDIAVSVYGISVNVLWPYIFYGKTKYCILLNQNWQKASCGHVPGFLKLFLEKCVHACVGAYLCFTIGTSVSKIIKW